MKLWLGGAVAATLLHITPTVVLVKRPDAAKALLPGGETVVAREVRLNGADRRRLQATVHWVPEDGVLTFYAGKNGDATTGTLLFVRVDNSEHGPVEVAVGFTTAGAILDVIVTKATVETKPWVLEAVRAG